MNNAVSISIKYSVIISCLFISVLFFFREIKITYKDTLTYGGTDLRARIIGSRLMMAGYDPYFKKWNAGMGEWLCDPNDTYNRPVNGVTVTPFLLWIQQPLANLNYTKIRLFWWASQQLLAIFIIAGCVYIYRRSLASILVIVVCAALLSNTSIWLYHSERGQIYILYAAWIMTLYATWHSKTNFSIILQAAWLAFGVLMRPSLLVFTLPAFIHASSRKKILLVFSFSVSMVILLALSGTINIWPHYFSAMQVYVDIEIWRLQFEQVKPPIRPTTIEGTRNITIFKSHAEMSYIESLYIFINEHGHRPSEKFYFIVCVCINVMLLLLKYLQTKLHLNTVQLLMMGTLFYVCTEVCMPYRAAYNLTTWLPAILVAVAYIFSEVEIRYYRKS